MTEAERLRQERRKAQKRQERKALMVGVLMEMMTFIAFVAASGILKQRAPPLEPARPAENKKPLT